MGLLETHREQSRGFQMASLVVSRNWRGFILLSNSTKSIMLARKHVKMIIDILAGKG